MVPSYHNDVFRFFSHSSFLHGRDGVQCRGGFCRHRSTPHPAPSTRTLSLHPTSCSLLSALCSLHPVLAPCPLHSAPALCSLHPAPCSLLPAICFLLLAHCTLFSALCSLPPATCSLPPALCSLHLLPAPCTLHPTPCTCTLHLAPCTSSVTEFLHPSSPELLQLRLAWQQLTYADQVTLNQHSPLHLY